MIESLKALDFSELAKMIMRESNQLHAICLDTYPPLFYMNESTTRIIKAITSLNETYGKENNGKNVCAYSVDAGFHCFVFTFKDNTDMVKEVLSKSGAQIERIIETGIDRHGS